MKPLQSLKYLLLLFVMHTAAWADITIDGVLDEQEWQTAIIYKDFVTTEPLSSEPAKYATEVRVISNDDGIYIGFSNTQPSHLKRVSRRFARDANINADRNTVAIDFDGNGLSGYDFTVGSANSIQDGIFTANDWSSDWDGNWHSQTSVDENHWYSEIHIPWTVAPMSKADHDLKTMKMWFSRIVYSESLRFAYPNASSQRSTFIQDWHPISIKQASTSTFEWFPYVSYSNNLEDNDSDWKSGLDIIWRPDSNTQITGAVNPDFGQVESDDLVINFSAFETFLTEKRPFFTENQALFSNQSSSDDSMVYTRRIGAGSDAGDEAISDIAAAAKFSRYGESSDYGIFAVIEDDSELSEGREFFTSRIQSQLHSTTVGHRLTYVDKPTLNRTAIVNALDFDARINSLHRLQGQLLHSDIDQTANPENELTNTDEKDTAGWLEWLYSPSDEWNYKATLSHYGDNFDMNDMGFMNRNDFNEIFIKAQHDVLHYDQYSTLLSSYTAVKGGYQENTSGKQLSQWAKVEQSFTFNSTRQISIELGIDSASWNDRITRGNGLYYRPNEYWGSVHFQSKTFEDFSFETGVFTNTSGTKAFSPGIYFDPQFYATDTFTISGMTSFQHYKEWLIWDYDTDQLATFESDQIITDLRLDWYPSTRQEVRLKFQWVSITSEAIEGFNLDSRGNLSPSNTVVSDFTVSDTALQLRYRYQIAPLSDIFLVYSRGGNFTSDRSDKDALTLFDEGWKEKQAEGVMAKIRYRFD